MGLGGTLKIEYQTTAFALYSIAFQSDQQQIAKVKHAHRIETHFRSPQLDLWLLALRRPEPVVLKKPGNVVVLSEQLLLPECAVTGELA